MGNRAVITTRENFDNNGVGVYVHWNGGETSVKAFLKYCELRGFRAPDEDNYGWARLAQVIANFMGGDGLSVGIDTLNHLDCDNGDNGTYIIEGWEIVGHEYSEPYNDDYDFNEMLQAIDEAQPKKQQLGEWLTAEEVPTAELNVGDTVLVRWWNGETKRAKILGFGADEYRNGTNVKGMPYADLCGNGKSEAKNNINNYIRTETAKRV